DSVAEATTGQFTDALKTTFDAGDKMQRSAVDLTLGMFTGEALNPNKWMRMASDAAKQSTEAVTKGMQGGKSTVQQAASTTAAVAGRAASAAERQGWVTM